MRHPGFGYWAAQILPDEQVAPDEQPDLAGWFGLRPVVPGSGWIDDWPEAPAEPLPEAEHGDVEYELRRDEWEY